VSELTERRNRETKELIADRAVDLFVDNGFAATSMDDVAQAAGVSRRTVYRHFASKEDLVFDYPRRWLERFLAELARGGALPTRDRINNAVMAVAASIASDPEPVLAAFSVLESAEALQERHARSDTEWIALVRNEILTDAPTGEDWNLRAQVVASALIGTTNAVIVAWAMSGPGANIGSLCADALELFDPMWPDECR
jgi:AcrR family transcriptional regulator